MYQQNNDNCLLAGSCEYLRRLFPQNVKWRSDTLLKKEKASSLGVDESCSLHDKPLLKILIDLELYYRWGNASPASLYRQEKMGLREMKWCVWSHPAYAQQAVESVSWLSLGLCGLMDRKIWVEVRPRPPPSFYQIINWILKLNLEEEPAQSELRIFVPSEYAANLKKKKKLQKICISLSLNVFESWFWITCVPAETKVQVLGEKCFFRSIVHFQFIYDGIFQTVNSLNMG